MLKNLGGGDEFVGSGFFDQGLKLPAYCCWRADDGYSSANHDAEPEPIAPRRPSQAQIDPARVKGFQGPELLSNHQGHIGCQE